MITLVLLGKLLEARAKAGTSAALEGLLRLQPKIAHVVRDGATIDVPLAQVVAGDRFVVRAGESIPVDGIVRDGSVERRREHADRREPPGAKRRQAPRCSRAR